jgi:hypothetical protein
VKLEPIVKIDPDVKVEPIVKVEPSSESASMPPSEEWRV